MDENSPLFYRNTLNTPWLPMYHNLNSSNGEVKRRSLRPVTSQIKTQLTTNNSDLSTVVRIKVNDQPKKGKVTANQSKARGWWQS